MKFLDKVKELEELFESDVQKAAAVALKITTQVGSLLNSKAAIVAESLIPNGAAYAADVAAVIKAFTPALIELADPTSAIYTPDGVKGLLQRLGSEITAIIHAGKKPFGFYVKAFEIAFDN